MSDLINATDSAMYNQRPAWHRKGVVLPENTTPRDAFDGSALDYPLIEVPLVGHGIEKNDGLIVPIPTHKAVLRGDSNRLLAVVGSDQCVMQRGALIDALPADSCVESMFTMRDGRDFCVSVRVGEWEAAPGDPCNDYDVIVDNCTGERNLILMRTGVWPVCNNTIRAGIKEAEAIVKVRHSRHAHDRIIDLVAAQTIAGNLSEQFRDIARALVAVKLSTSQRLDYWRSVYEATIGKLPKGPKLTNIEQNRQSHYNGWMYALAGLEQENQNQITSRRGTGWGAFSVLTDWSDHLRSARNTGKVTDTDDARLYSNLLGTSADWKGKAVTHALTLLG